MVGPRLPVSRDQNCAFFLAFRGQTTLDLRSQSAYLDLPRSKPLFLVFRDQNTLPDLPRSNHLPVFRDRTMFSDSEDEPIIGLLRIKPNPTVFRDHITLTGSPEPNPSYPAFRGRNHILTTFRGQNVFRSSETELLDLQRSKHLPALRSQNLPSEAKPIASLPRPRFTFVLGSYSTHSNSPLC